MKKLFGILMLVFVITKGFSGAVSAVDVHGHGKIVKNHHKYTDRQFIEYMVPHHQKAVEIADIALTRAEHPEIKQLAGNIKSSQSGEITEMHQRYKKWYGGNVFASDMMDTTNLNRLKTAKPFDKGFIKQMVPHHQMAMKMSRMALKDAKHPEIRKLARSIIKAQSAEIKEMQQWYKKWYGTNVPASSSMMSSSKIMSG